jgi:hypothetical protein
MNTSEGYRITRVGIVERRISYNIGRMLTFISTYFVLLNSIQSQVARKDREIAQNK